MRLATDVLRLSSAVWLTFASLACYSSTMCLTLVPGVTLAQAQQESAAASDDEEKERIAAERFLEVLIKRPTTGTALDKVFGYHVAKGDLGDVLQKLSARATASKDVDEAGRHWMLIGLLQLQRGEDAAAVKALAKAEEQLKQNPLAAFHHAQALQLIGDIDAAAASLQIAINRKPPKADYLVIAAQLGRLHQRAGKTDEALKVWNDLEKSFPNDDGVRQRIAAILSEEGDLAAALVRFDVLAKSAKNQNDQMSYAINAADLRIQLGQREQATKDLEALLAKLRPNSYLYDEARRRIETAFLSSGDYAGLAEYYERWVSEHKEDTDAVLRLARVLSIQGRSSEALKWFEQAIERAPTDSAPRLAIIDAYVAEGRYAEAATQYEQLVVSDATNPDYLVRWGQILMNDNAQPEPQRQQAAAAIWKRLADARPNDAAIQTQVADLLRSAKLNEPAIAGYQAAIKLAPDEPQHKEYLGEFLFRLEREEEALEVWRSLVAGESRTRDNLVRLAEVLHQFEQSDEALKTMSEACTMRPKVHERLRYAEWLRDAQQFDEAIAQLELARSEAESVDERDRVFASAVQTFQLAGQLKQRIEAAQKAADSALATAPESAEQWRQLAVLLDANRQTKEALDAIDKAVVIAPKSIETLDIAARMFEDAGRLPMAIEKRRLLADSDRRFRNGHLQRLATLQMRSGDVEAAIAAGREMLAGAGGSVDAFKFYAELCGQAGREDERIDTLRRCLRVNPRSEDAQQLLASQLAESFKTEQAIELYWKMLDSANDIEKRRGVVTKLADLYLRSNRLDQLIGRLELRGRESGDRRTAIDLVATAYQQAGDIGLAREALEGLLRENGRDTLLLERLVTLSEQAGESEKAIELQRQLLRITPGRPAEAKLASMLIDVGAMEEAQSMWFGMIEDSSDMQQLSRHIDRLYVAGENKTAIDFARRVVEKSASDWETRVQLMVLIASEGDWEASAKVAAEISSLNIDDDTPPVGAKPVKPSAAAARQVAQQAPKRLIRIQNLYQLYRLFDERYGYQSPTSLPKPVDFGQAKVMAQYITFKKMVAAGEDLSATVVDAKEKATAPDATANTLWDWYELNTLVSTVQQTDGIDFQDPATWGPLWRLAELDPAGQSTLIQMLSNRQSYARRTDVQLNIRPLDEQQLKWLSERAAKLADDDQAVASWPIYYAAELEIAGKKEEAEKLNSTLLTKLESASSYNQLQQALSYCANFGTDDKLWELINRTVEFPDQQTTSQQQYGIQSGVRMLALFTEQDRINNKLSPGAKDATYRSRVMQLFDRALSEDANNTTRRKTIRLTGIGGPRPSYRIVNGSYQSLEIPFPPAGIGPDDSFVQVFFNTKELLTDHISEWITHLSAERADQSPRERVMTKLALATLLQWSDKTPEAIGKIQEAIEFATNEVPLIEPEFRLMLADLLLRQNRQADALAAIESLSVYDQNTMAVREFAAAKLAAAIGDKARAQAAAKRLFAVRLDSDAQIELAKLMRSLDMRELAADLVRRMRSRGGSSTEQLRALLTYFQTQEEKEQAAEVAMELLQRTSASKTNTRSSNRGMTEEQMLRKTAIQVLASSEKLSALIAATEKRLERSPNSQRILGELAELYTGAGNTAKAAELLGGSTVESVDSTAALEALAKQLVASGKMKEACDAYLKLLPRKPQMFQNEFYEIKRPFEQTKRLGDLADMVIATGINKFESYRVSEICSDLIRDEQNPDKAKTLFLAVLDAPASGRNAGYNLNSIVSNSAELFKDDELVEKTIRYLLKSGKAAFETWGTLFSGYSTSGDGRHNNSVTYIVRAIAKNEKLLAINEQLLRDELKVKPDWHEAKAWLGLVLTVRKEYDQAKELLSPLANKETRPAPSTDALWLIGSLIDQHRPMQELAAQMYEIGMEKPTDRDSEFEYSMDARAAKLMADLGYKDRARAIVLAAIERDKKRPSRNYGDDDYEAYRQIRSTMGLMDFLSSVDFPADALRISRDLDKTLFNKAGQYERNMDVEFEKKQASLIEAVKKLGGVEVAASMVNDDAAAAAAVDFGVSINDRPFSERGLQSMWVDLLIESAAKPESTEALQKFIERLKSLTAARQTDDSVRAAWAIAAEVSGDRGPIRELIEQWSAQKEPPVDPLLRQRLLTFAVLTLYQGPASKVAEAESSQSVDRKLISNVAGPIAKDWALAERLALIAELGRISIERGDVSQGAAIWKTVLDIPDTPQSMLLDLSLAAINAGLTELSIQAAATAGKAPNRSLAAKADAVGGLGELLGTNRTNNMNSSSGSEEPKSEEIEFAKRIMRLDDAWKSKKVDASEVIEPLMKLTQADSAKPRPILSDLTAEDKKIVVDSVFDRLAIHVAQAQRTDELLKKLKPADVTANLLHVQLALRGDRAAVAKERLEAIEPESLVGAPKELVIQVIVQALNSTPCRKRAVELGLALLGQNKPAERYAEIEPFDTFALVLIERILGNGMRKEFLLSAMTDYLELTQHDNDRYSGDTGFQRRVSQLEELARMLLSKGRTEEALNYLGMRAPVFSMGMDYNNDWVGMWAMENLNSRKDRTDVYLTLADWTFSGDGALNSIAAFARRERLPEWIPNSVGGNYPTFPPVPDPKMPLATNYYFLLKLAEEAGKINDLKQRYADSIAKSRAGANEGLAITLAALKEPVPQEMLAAIDKRLAAIDPASSAAKAALPLAELQLATLLATDSTHAEWAKQTAGKVTSHVINLGGRAYVAPWLSRLQYLRGWSETAAHQPASKLAHWLSSTTATAHDFYEGDTPAVWTTDGSSRIDHICGFASDYMWLRYPLDGDFEFELEYPGETWRDGELWYNGLRFGAPAETVIDVQSESHDWMRFPTSAFKKNEWNKYAVKLSGDTMQYLVNGKAIYTEPRIVGSPWLALRALGVRNVTARNIKISGQPTIPRSVSLLSDQNMRGWTGTYYGQSLVASGMNTEAKDENGTKPSYSRFSPKPESKSELSWTLQNGELTNGDATTSGPGNQSVVQYQRPLADRESLTYEFYYEPGKVEVHPSISRTAYMLRPEGLRLHWMTEPNTSWGTPSDFEATPPGVANKPLPLKVNDWNQVELSLNGQKLSIALNGEMIYDQEIDIPAAGAIFGLFHYRDKSSVRVRNVQLKGPWPEQLPANIFATQ